MAFSGRLWSVLKPLPGRKTRFKVKIKTGNAGAQSKQLFFSDRKESAWPGGKERGSDRNRYSGFWHKGRLFSRISQFYLLRQFLA